MHRLDNSDPGAAGLLEIANRDRDVSANHKGVGWSLVVLIVAGQERIVYVLATKDLTQVAQLVSHVHDRRVRGGTGLHSSV
jgi:hypothetical protein